MIAIGLGSEKSLIKLLEIGCDINAINNNNENAFMKAATNHYSIDIIRLVIKYYKPDLEAVDMKGNTAFLKACQTKVPLEIIQELIKIGCDINVFNNEGQSFYNLYQLDTKFYVIMQTT